MGAIVIEIPQPINQRFSINEEKAVSLLDLLESPGLLHRKDDNKAEFAESMFNVIGIWSERFKTNEEAIEYARKIRRIGGSPDRH